MKAFLCATVLALTLPGCARIDGKTRDWLSTTVQAFAVVDGVLYEGSATLFRDRKGSVQLVSSQAPDQLCAGDMRYTASTGGVLALHCSSGADAAVSFVAIDELSGYGYGSTRQGPVDFTWGIAAKNAAAYLRLPPGPLPGATPVASPAP